MNRIERVKQLVDKVEILRKSESNFYELYDILLEEIKIEESIGNAKNHYLFMLNELKDKEAKVYKELTFTNSRPVYDNFCRAFLNTLGLGLTEKS